MEWYRYNDDWGAPTLGLLEDMPVSEGYYSAPEVAYRRSALDDVRGYTPLRQSRVQVATNLCRKGLLRGKAGQPTSLAWRPEGDRVLCGLGSGEIAAYSRLTLDCEDLKRVLAASSEITKIVPLHKSVRLLLGDASGSIHLTSTNLAPVSIIS
ncbi:hypothetical protein GNI_143080, partial [Gregarina niphandrodes]